MLTLAISIAAILGGHFGGHFATSTPSHLSGVTPGSHSWRVNEIFSNADGTIQFLEMVECCGLTTEVNLSGLAVTSASTGNAFALPEDLPPGSSANRHILLGTADFAALPGAPTPDHILPDGFFDVATDLLQWHIYPASVLSFAPGELPMDGFSSLAQSGAVGPNTPTNFAGQSGQINLGAGAPAMTWRGLLFFFGLLAVSGVALLRRPGSAVR